MKSNIINSFLDVDLEEFKLSLYTVYKNPKDFKGKFVARLFNVDQLTEYCVVKDTLEEVREALPEGSQKARAFAPR